MKEIKIKLSLEQLTVLNEICQSDSINNTPEEIIEALVKVVQTGWNRNGSWESRIIKSIGLGE